MIDRKRLRWKVINAIQPYAKVCNNYGVKQFTKGLHYTVIRSKRYTANSGSISRLLPSD